MTCFAPTFSSRSGRLRLAVRLAQPTDRVAIYRLRHRVYAEELHQYEPTPDGALSDALDSFNTYLIAEAGGDLAGFVSVTPPSAPSFSIDKYIDRDTLPFPLDAGVFEVRLLTVAEPFRGTAALALLVDAALGWVQAHGGTRIVCIGRREVVPMYERFGLVRLGHVIRSGRVEYEVMSAPIDELARRATELVRQTPGLSRLRERVATASLAAPCYHGGAFFEAIGARFDDLGRRHAVVNADVLDAWFDPSPRVIDALREHLPWLLKTSPPTNCEGLIHAIAETRGVEPANVLAGGGSSDLIYLAFRTWLTPRSRVLLLDPTYGEYAHVCECVIGCRVDRLVLSRYDGYRVDEGALSAVLSRGYDLAVIVNPNSPTGRMIDGRRLSAILTDAPRQTRVWVDETYTEYAGGMHSLERFAAASPNVVVCKSMSKVYALSGARAAYLCGSTGAMGALRPLNPPWAVSLPGQVAAVAALSDPTYYARRYAETHVLRRRLSADLAAFGLDIVPGVANFVLCHLPTEFPTAAEIVARCRASGVFLRDAATMGRSLSDRALRVAVKDAATNERIVAALQSSLKRGTVLDRAKGTEAPTPQEAVSPVG